MKPRTVFVLFTEDSGKHADPTLLALVTKLLVRVEPGTQTQRLDLQPARGEAREAWHAHRWRDRKNEAGFRALQRELATRLATRDFVVLHHDGDVPWGGRAGAPAHDAHIQRLRDALLRMGVDAAHLDERLLLLVPHYSIESWLYLNREAAERLVRDHGAPDEALRWLTDHASAAGGYDHLDKPKDTCPLEDRWNKALAENAWPAKGAATRSPSWAQAEADWGGRAALRAALQGTAG